MILIDALFHQKKKVCFDKNQQDVSAIFILGQILC